MAGHRIPRRALATLSTVVIGCSVAGCGSGLGSLPLPAPGIGSGGYLLNAVFANALNLPGHAKVKLAGADIGQMESMVARNYTAVTTLRIMDGARIPVGSTAELRSATCSSRSNHRQTSIRQHRCCAMATPSGWSPPRRLPPWSRC